MTDLELVSKKLRARAEKRPPESVFETSSQHNPDRPVVERLDRRLSSMLKMHIGSFAAHRRIGTQAQRHGVSYLTGFGWRRSRAELRRHSHPADRGPGGRQPRPAQRRADQPLPSEDPGRRRQAGPDRPGEHQRHQGQRRERPSLSHPAGRRDCHGPHGDGGRLAGRDCPAAGQAARSGHVGGRAAGQRGAFRAAKRDGPGFRVGRRPGARVAGRCCTPSFRPSCPVRCIPARRPSWPSCSTISTCGCGA